MEQLDRVNKVPTLGLRHSNRVYIAGAYMLICEQTTLFQYSVGKPSNINDVYM